MFPRTLLNKYTKASTNKCQQSSNDEWASACIDHSLQLVFLVPSFTSLALSNATRRQASTCLQDDVNTINVLETLADCRLPSLWQFISLQCNFEWTETLTFLWGNQTHSARGFVLALFFFSVSLHSLYKIVANWKHDRIWGASFSAKAAKNWALSRHVSSCMCITFFPVTQGPVKHRYRQYAQQHNQIYR